MISINFGKWSHAGGKFFLWDRIYLKGYKWTPFVKAKRRRKQDLISTMREMLNVQGWDGNWNCDPHMHGMYNGMEYMLAIVEGREPVFKEAPEQWGCDKDTSGIIGTEAIETTESPSETAAV